MYSSVSDVRWGLVFILASLFLFPISNSVAAGQGSGASIIGQVTDQSGGVLPGVTVTATSPALQVPQVTAVTNEVGEYRLAPLPIGVFQVAFELSGFRPIQRPNVRLTVGFTARIDVGLELASVAETVTVSGAAPVVDVASTSGSTLLTKELLDVAATSRNTLSFLTMAPGVRSLLDVGGNQLVETAHSRAFGQVGNTWYTIEGISGAQALWDSQTVDEAKVQSLGTDAEFWLHGVQLNAVVKSGGNEFHGGGFWAQTNHNFQADNIDEELEAQGITAGNTLQNQYDFGGDLGGRIVRNKLWFYGAARKRSHRYFVLDAFKPDGTPVEEANSQKHHTEKFSYQPTPSNRFIFFHQRLYTHELTSSDSLVAWESREEKSVGERWSKIEWEGVRGNSLIASLQYADTYYPRTVPFNTDGVPGRMDLETEMVSGETIAAGEEQKTYRRHAKGSVIAYKPNWFHGNHEFKVGFDYVASSEIAGTHAKQVNYMLLYNDSVPFEVSFFNSPIHPKVASNYLGIYLKDSWTVGRRLTLNYGLRYAHDDAFVPDQCRETAAAPSDVIFPAECFPHVQLPIWNTVAPRVHAAYDLSGDGKTVIKGGWGRYDQMRQFIVDVNRVSKGGIAYGVYKWRDLNGNNDYDDGETDRDPDGPDFVETAGEDFDAPPPTGVPNPNEKQPKQDEFSVSLERELIANMAMRVTGVYSRAMNTYRIQNNFRPYETYNIPITNQDPGPDGELGTADDGGPVTYYEFAETLQGARFEEMMPINDSRADANYKSVELAAVKRLSNRWQFMASYSATKKNRPFINTLAVGGFSEVERISSVTAGDLNPNEEFNRADRTWDWDAKFSGSYTFQGDVLVSGNFHHFSGDPFARQVEFEGGVTIPSIELNVEPIGTRRLPHINLLTLRAEKVFRVVQGHRLAVRLNVFNALNANSATRVQMGVGGDFLRPRAIMLPRIAEVSASYNF